MRKTPETQIKDNGNIDNLLTSPINEKNKSTKKLIKSWKLSMQKSCKTPNLKTLAIIAISLEMLQEILDYIIF